MKERKTRSPAVADLTVVRPKDTVEQSAPAVAAEVEKFVEKLVAGKTDHASARCDLMSALRQKGLWELSCDEDWLNGVLDLNFSLRCGWRSYSDGLHSAILDQWPAQEFYRAFSRPVYRDWPHRWADIGGQLYNGKMIALKDSHVWQALSAFGFPFPPFAVGSGMSVRDIDRSTAMKLGLIDRDRRVAPKSVPRPKLILLDPTPNEA
jgi:hypothetical protein